MRSLANTLFYGALALTSASISLGVAAEVVDSSTVENELGTR